MAHSQLVGNIGCQGWPGTKLRRQPGLWLVVNQGADVAAQMAADGLYQRISTDTQRG